MASFAVSSNPIPIPGKSKPKSCLTTAKQEEALALANKCTDLINSAEEGGDDDDWGDDAWYKNLNYFLTEPCNMQGFLFIYFWTYSFIFFSQTITSFRQSFGIVCSELYSL